MPYETFTVGDEVFKAQGARANLIRAAMMGLGERFTLELGKQRIRDCCQDPALWDGVLPNIEEHGRMMSDIIRLLDDVVLNHPLVFKNTFRCIEFPSKDGTTMEIPNEFRVLLDIDADGVGKGELIPLLLCRNDVHWSGAHSAYDLRIDGQHWHFKDHSNSTASLMGRPDGCDDLYDAPIMRFIASLGIRVKKFGCDDFKDRPGIEEAVTQRYGLDLERSALAFEAELQDAFRRSPCFGDAQGVLYLKRRDDGSAYIQRVDVTSVSFHSSTSRGLKTCDSQGVCRFAEAILHRTRRETREIAQRQEAEAREAARMEARVIRQREKEQRQTQRADARRLDRMERALERQVKRDNERRAREAARSAEIVAAAKEFANVFNGCGRMNETARLLGISDSTASKRKRDAIAYGFELNPPVRIGVKDADRNRGRRTKARDKGTLGPDTPCVAGE